MKYTYGYIKDAVLAKMDLSSEDANELGLLNKIPFYANEALTQITSGIKPNQKYAIFDIHDRSRFVGGLKHKYNLSMTDFLDNENIPDAKLSPKWLRAREEYRSTNFAGIPCDMPTDFIGWNQNPVYKAEPIDFGSQAIFDTVTTADYGTYGSDKIVFYKPGIYHMPYNADWYKFSPTTPDKEELNIPADIIEAIPSYIASQLFKIDDETKSLMFRNEFEYALGRIDDNMSGTPTIIKEGSNW